jgi:fibronectin type 3 domain-containing protein
MMSRFLLIHKLTIKLQGILVNAACCLVMAACFLLPACGKKGAPTLKAYEKPEPPSRVTAICRRSEIILHWDFPKDRQSMIKGFYLMRASDGDFEKIAFIENNKRIYTDTDFKPADTNRYKIISLNLREITGHDSNVVEVKPQTLPEPPGDLSFAIEYNALALTWKSPENGFSYNIYKSNTPGMYPEAAFNKQPVKELSFKDVFDVTKPVYYTIRSIVGDSVRYEGPSSAELSVNPQEFVPSQPEKFQAIAAPDSVYLIWKESAETWTTGYRVYRETKKKEGFVLIGEPQIPSFTDKEKPSSKRSYRVTAVGPGREGPPAEIRNVVYIKPR